MEQRSELLKRINLSKNEREREVGELLSGGRTRDLDGILTRRDT